MRRLFGYSLLAWGTFILVALGLSFEGRVAGLSLATRLFFALGAALGSALLIVPGYLLLRDRGRPEGDSDDTLG